MAWNEEIPQATDIIKVSQADLLGNFQALGTYLQVNHSNFNTLNAGKHKFVQLPQQSTTPEATNQEITIFSRLSQNPVIAGEVVLCQKLSEVLDEAGPVIEFSVLEANWARTPDGSLFKWEKFTVNVGSFGTFGRNDVKLWTTAGNAIPFTTIDNVFFTPICANPGGNIGATCSIGVDPTIEGFTLQIETTNEVLGGWNAFSIYAFATGT